MKDVTVHTASGEWCVHFVFTVTQIPIGPCLLFNSSDDIKAKIFAWGHVTAQEIEKYEIDLRRWGIGSVHKFFDSKQAIGEAICSHCLGAGLSEVEESVAATSSPV